MPPWRCPVGKPLTEPRNLLTKCLPFLRYASINYLDNGELAREDACDRLHDRIKAMLREPQSWQPHPDTVRLEKLEVLMERTGDWAHWPEGPIKGGLRAWIDRQGEQP